MSLSFCCFAPFVHGFIRVDSRSFAADFGERYANPILRITERISQS